jgi:hypothetical protein
VRIGVRPSRLPGLLADLLASSVTAGLGTGVEPAALEWISDGTLLIRVQGTEEARSASFSRSTSSRMSSA